MLADHSLKGTPDQWGKAAVDLYDATEADRIVGEVNYGGDMVGNVVRSVRPAISYGDVRATRGKQVRAEPVVALYEQGRVHHVGTFGDLESEMTTWTPEAGWSPNRLERVGVGHHRAEVGARHCVENGDIGTVGVLGFADMGCNCGSKSQQAKQVTETQKTVEANNAKLREARAKAQARENASKVMDPFAFVLVALGASRLTRLIVSDSITRPLREWVWLRYPADSTQFGDSEVKVGGTDTFGRKIGHSAVYGSSRARRRGLVPRSIPILSGTSLPVDGPRGSGSGVASFAAWVTWPSLVYVFAALAVTELVGIVNDRL
ncbi:MAG: hypothetical protein U5Q03_15030 [Bacteroidota bacterium]|nr:hypothetical protein [Bacteroidota bacterium]